MPYNLEIPGEVTEQELKAIELIARAVPKNGVVVEVGSFMGRSSWAWAKSVDPSVTVYCVDPWENYRDVKDPSFPYREYGLDAFKQYVKDCPNLIPMQGRSPRDFMQWDKPIDCYFEDAVHKNPILHENLAVWGARLNPQGIACGHDYTRKFPDVMAEAQALAKQRGCAVKVVRSLWCLVPRNAAAAPASLRALSRELTSLQAHHIACFNHEIKLTEFPEKAVLGEPLKIRGALRNVSGENWPVIVDKTPVLKLGIRLRQAGGEAILSTAAVNIPGNTLQPGQSVPFEVSIDTSRLPAGELEAVLEPHYQYSFWFSAKGADPLRRQFQLVPPIKFTAIEPGLGIERNAFWQQYVPDFNPGSPLPARQTGPQCYQLQAAGKPVEIRSMLLPYEIALIYALARDAYSGQGEIIDLGPLLGMSTHMFARGLRDNPRPFERAKRVHSFDLFLMDRMEHFLPERDGGLTGSLFPRFMEINQDLLEHISINPGDFMKMSWSGKPVELLFIDMSKSLDLNRRIVRNFFGCLIPGRSIVIQQDYAHSGEYWIPITMELLRDYFQPLHFMLGATATFLLKQPIPPEALDLDIAALPLERQTELLDAAIAAAPPSVAEVLKTSKAMCLARNGQPAAALETLKTVSTERKTSDLASDFSAVAQGNADAVRKEIKSKSPGLLS